MQSLGLSESAPKPERRLKLLFWPRIKYPEDIDLLGTQGYWVCVSLAAFTLLSSVLRQSGLGSSIDALYYYLAGAGIRRTSRFAALSAFLIYLISVIVAVRTAHGGGVMSIFFLALLLSNVRATWLAKRVMIDRDLPHVSESAEPGPGSFFTDRLPRLIWPVGQWLFYVLTVLMFTGLILLLVRTTRNLPA